MTAQVLGRDRVLASYGDAVNAIRELDFDSANWDEPTPCGDWTLVQLAGHMHAIARYWLRLLDAAESGHHLVDLPRGDELAAMNASDLRDMESIPATERIEQFLLLATSHLERLRTTDFTIALGEWSGIGPLTVAQHTGVAIGEWHVHAWDMARSIGSGHRPGDAEVVAAGNRVIRDIPSASDPWEAVLVAYGRDPGWSAST